MQLIRWRAVNGLSVRRAAALCSIKSAGNFSRIEHGGIWPAPDTVEQIYWVTKALGPSAVTVQDHLEAWRKNNPQLSADARDAARLAAREHRKLAGKPKSKKQPGSPIAAIRPNGEASNGKTKQCGER